MKLFDILKQQGLFSNDIKTRIKNNQIIMNGEQVKADIELNISFNSDIFDEFILKNIGEFTISNAKENGRITKDEFENIFDVLSKFNVRRSDLEDITFIDAKILSSTPIVFDSGSFIADVISQNSIFATQMKIFGFENLFDSNIKNDLTDILNQFIFIKISKKDSFVLKKRKWEEEN